MRLLKQALTVLGTVVVIAIIAALVTPQTAHAIIATAVQVVNTSANPVPVVSGDNPARQAVALTVNLFIPDGQIAGSLSFSDSNGPYTVPAGTRLVIDSLSAVDNLPAGQKPLLFQVHTSNTNPNGGFTGGYFNPALQFVTSGSGIDSYETAQNFRAYADGGSQVTLFCDRSPYSAGGEGCFATLYGHLENVQ
jgi:hypothetical protein